MNNQEVFDNSNSLQTHRLLSNGSNNYELEFSKKWQEWEQRESKYNDGLLSLIMSVPCSRSDPANFRTSLAAQPMKHPIGEPTERDRQVAESVIQWLGTNVGQCFIQEVFNTKSVPGGDT